MQNCKIDVIGKLDVEAGNIVKEYLNSKLHNKTYLKPPNWDSSGDSLELLYYQNLREHTAHVELQKSLITCTERQEERNKLRSHEICKTHDQLRKRLIEVNQFKKECFDKRQLAENIIDNEKKVHEMLRIDLNRCHDMYQKFETFRKDLKATLEEFRPYEGIATEVVQQSNLYESIGDCTDRCDALMLAQTEIHKLEQVKVGEIEQMRKAIIKFANDGAYAVMGLRTSLLETSRSYNRACVLVMKWEKTLAAAQLEVANVSRDKVDSIDGINGLYQLLVKRNLQRSSKKPKKKYSTFELRLDFIKTEVELLKQVVETCDNEKKKYKTGLKSIDVNC